jgi:hypothetical protein
VTDRFGLRVYLSEAGVFASTDSLGAASYLMRPNGLGPWAYTSNNPLRYVDPDGRDEKDLRCVMDGRANCDAFGAGSLAPLAIKVRDARIAAESSQGDEARATAVANYSRQLSRFENAAGWRYDFHGNVGLPVVVTAGGIAGGVALTAGLAAGIEGGAVGYYMRLAWNAGPLARTAILGAGVVSLLSVPKMISGVREEYVRCASYSGSDDLGACFNFGADTGALVEPASQVVNSGAGFLSKYLLEPPYRFAAGGVRTSLKGPGPSAAARALYAAARRRAQYRALAGELVDYASTQTWDTGRNAEILRTNMEELEELGTTFGPGDNAHHIVASTHPDAQRARAILDQFGIDVNSAANGVRLRPEQHRGRGLHSLLGIARVTDILENAALSNDRDEVIAALRSVADDILSGQFP